MRKIPPRLHLLPAREADLLVVIARVRAKSFHVMRINTKSGSVEHGSWFRGVLYAKRCDISLDGRWLVYLALGAKGKTWNAVSEAPWLQAAVQVDHLGTWFGGGVFSDTQTLLANGWDVDEPNKTSRSHLPFSIRPWGPELGNAEDLGPLYRRLQRDGFTSGNTPHDDSEWSRRPARNLPLLRMRYIGYDHGYKFAFALEGSPLDLDLSEWACWDAGNNLWVARNGQLEQYDGKGLGTANPSRVIDLNWLTPPAIPPKQMPPPDPPPRRVGASRKKKDPA